MRLARTFLPADRSAKPLIAREGFDPQSGACPIKRVSQDRLLDPLATKLLLGEFKPGDRIKVAARDGKLEFVKKYGKRFALFHSQRYGFVYDYSGC